MQLKATEKAVLLLSSKSNKSHKSIAEYGRIIINQQAEIDDLKLKLERMNEILANMQRAHFGQSSEKQKYVSPDQLSIFNEAEAEQNPKSSEPDEKTIVVPEHKRKKKKTLEEKIAELPFEEVILDIADDEKICSYCGSTLRRMGKKFIRKEIVKIQKTIKAVFYYAYTYTCDNREKNEGVSRIKTV